MTISANLTPRSQKIWAAQILATAPDRDALARRVGVTRAMLSRMLACRERVPDDLARKLAALCGLTIVPRSLHGFTLEAAA